MPPSSSSTARLTHITAHLSHRIPPTPSASTSAASTSTPTVAMAPARPPITCHILDTTTGRPAPAVHTTLACLSHPPAVFTALTDADGRVTAWDPAPPASATSLTPDDADRDDRGEPLTDLRAFLDRHPGTTRWELRFRTGAYYRRRDMTTFFPEVVVMFEIGEAQRGEHFHVPLLVGPYTYTTYRGS